MKIGIIGGTFDPIHYGHLLLGERFRQELNLDKVIFIPTGRSYHKMDTSVKPAHLRYEMVELAVKDNPYFMVSDIEIKREGNSYTCDTVRELKKIYKDDEIYFMIGTDVIFTIETWKEIDWLFKNTQFLLALRSGHHEEVINKQLFHLINDRGANIIMRDFELVNISSSAIRENVKNGKSIKYLVPIAVEEFIKTNKLYSPM